jgi:hypothetical protein
MMMMMKIRMMMAVVVVVVVIMMMMMIIVPSQHLVEIRAYEVVIEQRGAEVAGPVLEDIRAFLQRLFLSYNETHFAKLINPYVQVWLFARF